MFPKLVDALTNQLTPQLLLELIVTFLAVLGVVYIFKSDLVRNDKKLVDPNEEKRKRDLEAIKKSTNRSNAQKKLKNKLNSEGRG